MKKGHDYLKRIVGSKLSAITFVLDYYQFQFDGPLFNVLTPVTFISGSNQTRSGEDQFRNRVCAQIGKIVHGITIHENKELVITFEDDSQLLFSLQEKDYPGPEAVIFNDGPMLFSDNLPNKALHLTTTPCRQVSWSLSL